MMQRLFACVTLCLLIGYSNAVAFMPVNQSAPCDDWVPGDFDVDGDIDTDDFNFLQSCQTGASVPVSLSCKRADLDADNDVDMDDFGIWQRMMTGAQDCGPNLKEPSTAPPAEPTQIPSVDYRMLDVKGVHSVYGFSGEFYQQVEDLRIKGRGLDLVWARKYRSRIGLDTTMGNGWDFSYNIKIERVGPSIRLYTGNNRTEVYNIQANGKYIRFDLARELSRNPDGSYTLTFADTSTWELMPLDGSPAAGKISEIQDRNGNALTFSYDGLGRLSTIHDTLDRDTTIAYNPDGYIASITDYTGRSVTYAYYQSGDAGGSLGDLKSVTTSSVVGTPNNNDFPSGKTTIYTYSKDFPDERLNHNLLTITDPKGQIYLTNLYGTDSDTSQTYQFDRVIQQVWGDVGDRINLVYKSQSPTTGNNFAVVKTTINDRVGNVSEYSHDLHNRQVIVRQYTGRADPDFPTDIDQGINPPINPLRLTDPPFFTTVIAYSQFGNESSYSYPLRINYPNGNAVEFDYEFALNPNGLQRSSLNLREIRRLPGPLGGDQTQIIEEYEYHPVINFLTRHTGPRGFETLHTYDPAGNRIHTEYPIGSVEDWEYNAHGQMTAHTYPDNGSSHRRRDEFTYYSSGSQKGYLHEEIVDAPALALTTAHEYDSLGRVIRTVDPRGNDTLFIWNELDQVVRRTSREVSAGIGVRYQRDIFYDLNDNVTRVELSDPSNPGVAHATAYEYETNNFTTSITVEQGPAPLTVLAYGYDANRNRTLTRFGEAVNGNQPANTLAVQYDERGMKFKETRGAGIPQQSTTQYDYDPNGNQLRIASGLESGEHTTLSSYDGYNRRVSTTDAMGNVHTYTYDPAGNLSTDILDGAATADLPGSIDDVRLRELGYTYDAMNRRIRQTDAFFTPQTQDPMGDGQVITEFDYADTGNLVRIENDNGNAWQISYDTANRRSVVTDPKSNKTTYSYDANGNVVGVTEVDKSDLLSPQQTIITSFSYDNLDRVTSRIDNATHMTTYEYDFRGNIVRSTDPRNTETVLNYDELDRLTQSIVDMNSTGASPADPDDIVNSQTWDASSRLIARTDDNGHATQYIYDPLDRLTTVRNADQTITTMTYNAHGQVVSMTDANGTSISYSYDLLNRRTGKTITPAPGVVGTTSETYVFDGASRVISATDDDSEITRQFDSLSQTLVETQQLIPGGPLRTVTSEYDGVGNRIRLVYPGGRDIGYTFDSLNRVTQISDNPPVPGSTLATYSYFGPERVERRELGNGTRMAIGYDSIRRVINTHHSVIATSANIDNRTYAYDANDNKLEVQAAGALPPDVHIYGYDPADRMTLSQDPSAGLSIFYTFDGAGNRTNVSAGPDAGTYVRDPAQPEPADDQVNQYTSVNNPPTIQSRTYDRNGNLKTSHSGQRHYSYDYRNQLSEFTDIPAGLTIIYKYDCLGRRLEQNVGSVLTRFYYDGLQNIEEQNQSNITLATYVYKFTLTCTGWTDSNGPLTMTRSGQKYFYHPDELGNTIKLTNAGGQIVEQYRYTDFGKPTYFDIFGNPIPGSTAGNPFLFRGDRYDTGTGLLRIEPYAIDVHGNWNFNPLGTSGKGVQPTKSGSLDSGNNVNWSFGGKAIPGALVDPSVGRPITRVNLLLKHLTEANNPASKIDPDKRTYSVQYRESDFSFTNRLLDEESTYYTAKLRGVTPSTVRPASAVGSGQMPVVAGLPDETVSTDKYGRVKVSFFWDREGKKDSNSSCWARVSQSPAGSGLVDVTSNINPLIIPLTPGSTLLPGGDVNEPSGDGNDPGDALNVDDEKPLVSGSTTVKNTGGCGATGFEAVPFMLLWLGVYKRRLRRSRAKV